MAGKTQKEDHYYLGLQPLPSQPNGTWNQMHSSGHVQQSPASAIDDLTAKESWIPCSDGM